MNEGASDLARWSLRRWVVSLLAVFLAQVLLICLLGERLAPPRPAAPAHTAIHLAADPWATKQLLESLSLDDPTLFALPNTHGFSGAAWLKFSPVTYAIQPWSELPRWLALNAEHLGEPFAGFVRTNIWPPLLISDLPMPRSVIPDFQGLTVPMPARSEYWVEGDLAARPMREPLPVASWPCANVLSKSVVELLVDADGWTFSARLLTGCGLSDAD